MTASLGRADLHIHTRASDGTASVAQILDAVTALGDLDVIAITDHERIDAAVAARHVALDRGLPYEVIVGEEVTTRGGHVLGLFLETRVRSLRSLRSTIAEIHDQGGIAIPSHPLAPYPLCAQGWVLRALLDDPDPRVRPDAVETFNPTIAGRYWHAQVVRFAADRNLPSVGGSDAHMLEQIGQCHTTFPGRSGEDLRAAVLAGTTHAHGNFHGTSHQLSQLRRQLGKYGQDIRDEVGGRVRRNGMGRDHGYPGGRARPPRFEPSFREAGRPGLEPEA